LRYNRLLIGIFFLFSVTVKAMTVPDVTVIHHNKRSIFFHSSLIKITEKKIHAMAATSISELLASQSSLQLQDLNGDHSDMVVSMRGFGANAVSNTLIMIDGIPQNNPDLASANINQIPISDVKEIDIMPGSHNILYGGHAGAGVINIITKQVDASAAHVSIAAGSYQHSIYHADMSHRYKSGIDYRVALTSDTTNNYRDHDDYDQYQLGLHLGYQGNNSEWGFDYRGLKQRQQYPGALTSAQMAKNRRQYNPGILGLFDDSLKQIGNITWKQLLNKHWSANNIISYRNDTEAGTFKQQRHIIIVKPRLLAHYSHSNIILGTDLEHDQYAMSSVEMRDNERQLISGIYGLWRYQMFRRWSIQLGARAALLDMNYAGTYSNGVDNDQAAITQQQVYYQTSKTSALYLKRAGNFRFPKAEENAAIAPGISHLETQHGVTYELGYKWDNGVNQLISDIYYMLLKHEISFDPTPVAAQKFGVNRNLPPTKRQGLDITATHELMSGLQLGVGYSYNDAVFRSGNFSGHRIPFVAQNVIKTDARYQYHSHWVFYSEALFTGDRYAASDDANAASKVPRCWLVNSAITYRYHRLSVSLRFNNIFNAMYNSYVTVASNNQEAFYPAPGRNMMLRLGYQLW
jgi:iron complex outermembrane recepter protein